MGKQNRVRIRRVNFTPNVTEDRVVQEVRICPRCDSVLLDGKVICDKCGRYVYETNMEE
jgi:hypothetical protein